MEIKCIAGFSVITKQPAASASLYQETFGLPLERLDDHPDYLFADKFPGANHFGVWPLKMAAQSWGVSADLHHAFPLRHAGDRFLGLAFRSLGRRAVSSYLTVHQMNALLSL